MDIGQGIMMLLSREELRKLLIERRISKRLIRDLRYVPEEIMCIEFRDFLAIRTKSGAEGVLLTGRDVYPFELQKRQPNRSGRIEPIICDICATWRRGTESTILVFRKTVRHSISYLVCDDLDCSLHVRNLTSASTLSRTQLREDITAEARVERLNIRLGAILER